MKSLVTGAAGMMGSHVVDALIARGDEVVALDDLSGGFSGNVNPEARFVKMDIWDRRAIESLFEDERFDLVYHFAAYAAEGLSHFIRRFNYTNNLIGSVNLINESVKHGVKCFVFTSSIAVYGSGVCPLKESYEPKPEDPYGISKLAVELDLKAAHEMFGLNYVVFRPHNVFGERQNLSDPYRNVVGIFIRAALEGTPLPIFGDGQQTRAFTYIRDVAPVIAKAVEFPDAYNQTFNIGGDVPYTVKEVAEAVCDLMNITPNLEYHEARKEVFSAWCDHSKAEAAFGAVNRTPFLEGLRRMILWAKVERCECPGWPPAPRLFDGIEVEKNMPERWRKLCRV